MNERIRVTLRQPLSVSAALVLWPASLLCLRISHRTGAKADVRSFAAEGLGGYSGPAAVNAVAALVTALGDAEASVRWSAAAALGGIGPGAVDAVPALVTALGDAEQRVRSFAAGALGRIGPGAVDAVPALVTALGDEARVRSYAAAALGGIGPGRSTPCRRWSPGLGATTRRISARSQPDPLNRSIGSSKPRRLLGRN